MSNAAHSHDDSGTVLFRINEYFRRFGYKCPTDSLNGPFQWVLNTKLPYFEWIHESPEMMGDFNTLMQGMRSTRKHWVDWFPVDKELFNGFAGGKNDVLMVDLGGGRGHDLERFLADFPDAKGHLVLQDLPATISDVKELSDGITTVAHDFFTPQPVKGKFFFPITISPYQCHESD